MIGVQLCNNDLRELLHTQTCSSTLANFMTSINRNDLMSACSSSNKTESKFSPRPRANSFCNLFKWIQLLPVLSNFIYNTINPKLCNQNILLDRKIWKNTIKIYSGHSKAFESRSNVFCQDNYIFPSAIMLLEMYKIYFIQLS